MTPAILSILTPVVPASRHHLIAPDAELEADLRLCALDRLTIAHVVEEHFNFIMPDAEFERWQTVADIVASVERRERVEA
ncbi:MAG: acyl carrier protein [Novosphingobium sp.]|nr:acyl carrier protein [Novosphingobium sp.]